MNKRDKQCAILSLLKMNKVGIGALLENKLKKDKVDDMMAKLFLGWDYYSSNVTEGRILVIWQKSFIKVQVLMEHQQFIHCLVKLTGVQTVFLVTFVYGLNTMEERLELWKGLSFTPLPEKPWLTVGDFNAVFHFDDRAGGKTISVAEIHDSTAWLAQIQMAGWWGRVYSKIDHAFSNENWAEFQWDVNSDHCYCLIKTHKHGNLGTKPFRFFNLWIAHRGFKEVVSSNWNKPMVVRGLQGVIKKLLRLKHVLKAFNRDEIGDVGKRYHQAKGEYQLALNRAQTSPTNIQVQEAEKFVVARYQHHHAMYRSFLIQRSKVTWLQKGDDNNSYFHACIKKRREENRIVSFQNEQGVVIDDYNKVVHHFLDHFRGYMGSTSSAISTINSQCIDLGPCLGIEMQLRLIRKFRKSDVKKALFSIPGTKSLGPDGYGSEFYKAMWQDIGDEISEAILEFFNTGKIPAELNETVLALVPKIDMPSSALRATQHDFKFHPLCKSLKIINLFFADDLIIFCKANKGSVQRVKPIFEDFCSSTGLKANQSKSQVYFGGVPNTDKLRLHTWASRHLSYAGRTQLITSVLLGLRNYWMNIFLLPQSIVKEVDKLCLWFLWGNNGTRSNFHLASWSKVCLPKALGGLGFGEEAKWNKATLAKYIWAISHQQETLWMKWINTVYLKGQCFWHYQLEADSSWYWHKLCHIRDVFTQKDIDDAGS
ncbi:uncharacterized protein LOC133825618 [Humulus lupulus]|uniref:uncharacterized protein LOC133825618 n=1 Tax=Humulus lupulus TaxID=3486 RepID=UPI002B40FC52|nr:uncharacterized protein LOC133825618 [Humulus lupulus]